MTPSPKPAQQFATLTLRLAARESGSSPQGPSTAALLAAADSLEDVAAVLAMEEAVSGVETRSPEHARVDAPELTLYTTPAALPAVRRRAEQVLRGFGLQAEVSESIRDDDDWRDAWKRHYRKLYFGPTLHPDGNGPPEQATFMVRPSWLSRTPGDPGCEVVLDPGRAFGTGLHETTRLCLHRLCTLACAGDPPSRALDLGSGSGILALAVLRLWPDLKRVVALDVDPEATETIRENATANELEDRIEVVTGQLADAPAQPWDLVLANIRPEVLIPIAPALARAIAPRSRATLSGILQEEEHRVASAYLGAGWTFDDFATEGRRRLGEWVALDLALDPALDPALDLGAQG